MKRLCNTCAHDGQCEGLPYCGGRYYEKYDEEEDDAADEEEDENRNEPRPGYGDDALDRVRRNLP